MITTSEITASPELLPFVRCYTFREFDTKGLNLVKPWHATHEISMYFYFKALPLQLICPHTGQILKTGTYGGFTGSGTRYNGEMIFNGCYALFEVIFKPNGFTRIFGLPARHLINLIVDAEDVLGPAITIFYEQLCCARDFTEMGSLTNAYLLSSLKKQKFNGSKDSITSVSNLMVKNKGLTQVDKLSFDANMSIRNFERLFAEQVGIPPKVFSCIIRFNHAFEIKLKDTSKDWTSIAHECGYFDQMHMIRDFKRFAGSNPSTFLKHTPLTKETYTSRIE